MTGGRTPIALPARLRPWLAPSALALAALLLFNTRVSLEMADFAVYRTAAERVRAVEPLYRPADGHYQFKYLPAFALAMTPLTFVDERASQALWFAMSVGLLAALVRWSVAALPGRRRSKRALTWLAVLFMAKFYAHELTLGQANILLGALLLAALLALEAGRPRAVGLLVGLAACVKPYALILLPWVAATGGPAAAGACLAAFALELALPAAVYGWSGNLDLLAGWYRTVTASTAPNLLGNDNISLAAMWAKWIGPTSTATALAGVSSVAALGLAGAVWRERTRVESPAYLECALLMLIVPLVSPQGWDYVLLLGTPAVVLILDRWREIHGPWRWAIGAALGLMCFTLFDVMGRALYGRFMALSLVTVCAAVVAAGLGHLRWRRLA